MKSNATLAFCATMLAAANGCSLMFIDGPRSNASVRDTPVCDTGKGWVAVDTVFGLLNGVGLVAAAMNDDPQSDRKLDIGVRATVAVVWFSSAIAGSRTANKCKDAVAKHDAWIRGEANDAPIAVDDPICSGHIARWRGERDLVRRTRLYEIMPAECKALVTRTQKEE